MRVPLRIEFKPYKHDARASRFQPRSGNSKVCECDTCAKSFTHPASILMGIAGGMARAMFGQRRRLSRNQVVGSKPIAILEEFTGMQDHGEPIALKRSLGLPLLTFYGVGTIVGGGFYALIGEIAGCAGYHLPVAMLLASVIALFSALAYAELSARFPYCAGEAHYVREAFAWKWPSTLIGWLVIATGVVSAATLARAFAVFAQSLFGIPIELTIVIMVASLGALCVWGITQSVWFAAAITVVEVGGLLFVVLIAGDNLRQLPDKANAIIPSLALDDWTGILLGAYLAFYSFVGFEDMVNVAEEAKNPKRDLPRSILLALALTSFLYVVVSLVAVLTIAPAELARHPTPLSLVVGGGRSAVALSTIGMLAGINGALVQIIMSSRVAYGLAIRNQAPAVFANVNVRTQTPAVATIAAAACVLLFSLALPLAALAKLTSTVLLIIYGVINLSLVVIKRREQTAPPDAPHLSIFFPWTGFCLCVLFVLLQITMQIVAWT